LLNDSPHRIDQLPPTQTNCPEQLQRLEQNPCLASLQGSPFGTQLAQAVPSPSPGAPSNPTTPTPFPTASVAPTPTPEQPSNPNASFYISPLDLLILIAYLVCILAAITRIINSFNDEYAVRLDEAALKQNLADQNLQDLIGVSFSFDKRYEFGKNDKLKKFGVSITNKSKTHSIYVDWDYCTMTDLGSKARRVNRLMPGTTLDLFQPQVFSAIAPETTLKETITAEDVLKRKDPKDDKASVALEMDVSKPLLDFGGLPKGKDPEKKKYTRFVATLQTLEFYLVLAVRVVGPARSSTDHALIRCRFILQKLPWQAGLPWNPR